MREGTPATERYSLPGGDCAMQVHVDCTLLKDTIKLLASMAEYCVVATSVHSPAALATPVRPRRPRKVRATPAKVHEACCGKPGMMLHCPSELLRSA